MTTKPQAGRVACADDPELTELTWTPTNIGDERMVLQLESEIHSEEDRFSLSKETAVALAIDLLAWARG